jgi:Ser/Thr protein kinase RdoA (MazF antagonist)
LWDLAEEHPQNARQYGLALGAVHLQLRSLPVPVVLPELRSRLVAKLHLAGSAILEELPDLIRLTEMLFGSASATVMCHGDLHPKNVLMSANGPVLVDWFDASRGPWLADVARTTLLLESGAGKDGPRPLWLNDLQEGYVATVGEAVAIDPTELHRWRVVCAAARLAEGLQVDATLELIRRELGVALEPIFRLDRVV